MKRTIGTVSRALASSVAIGALAAMGLGSSPAVAEEVVIVPPEIIATQVPVYHEGHAVYWYNGHWHYRDPHGAWAYYHEEPAFLRTWRSTHVVEFHHYGRR